jgi:hypothetical protein
MQNGALSETQMGDLEPSVFNVFDDRLSRLSKEGVKADFPRPGRGRERFRVRTRLGNMENARAEPGVLE